MSLQQVIFRSKKGHFGISNFETKYCSRRQLAVRQERRYRHGRGHLRHFCFGQVTKKMRIFFGASKIFRLDSSRWFLIPNRFLIRAAGTDGSDVKMDGRAIVDWKGHLHMQWKVDLQLVWIKDLPILSWSTGLWVISSLVLLQSQFILHKALLKW